MGCIDIMIVGSTNDSLFKYDHVKERVSRVRWKVHIHWPGLGNMWPGYGEILDLDSNSQNTWSERSNGTYISWPGFGCLNFLGEKNWISYL